MMRPCAATCWPWPAPRSCARSVNLPQRNAEWELLDDRGAEAPAITKNGTPGTLGRGCENIWRALRILGEVSAEEAAASASAGGVTISAEGARVYLQGLNLAGYVTRNGGTASNPARYRLIPSRYTGPRHPVYQRSNYAQVYDPNLGEIVWSKGQQSGEPDGLRRSRPPAPPVKPPDPLRRPHNSRRTAGGSPGGNPVNTGPDRLGHRAAAVGAPTRRRSRTEQPHPGRRAHRHEPIRRHPGPGQPLPPRAPPPASSAA
ncbi:hypothetical protein P4112_24735 [Pseudomonas aeruginosa]|nr:hypothetical protein [Pseudomonas aeruginosa]